MINRQGAGVVATHPAAVGRGVALLAAIWWRTIDAGGWNGAALVASVVAGRRNGVQLSMAAPNCIKFVAMAPSNTTHVALRTPRTRNCVMP